MMSPNLKALTILFSGIPRVAEVAIAVSVVSIAVSGCFCCCCY